MNNCYCGSDKPFSECCEPLLKKEKKAETAEMLMRSRYTAFVKNDINHIKNTTHPDRLNEFNEESTRQWASGSKWQGLEIYDVVEGKSDDEKGFVEFNAKFNQQGYDLNHHEKAEFKKKDGEWYFYDGHQVSKQVIRDDPKVGRNDPCPCGSGKKYKKCCGK